MTEKQRHSRNQAWHLLSIAQSILNDAGLVGYAADVEAVALTMRRDARKEAEQTQQELMGN